MPVSPPPVKQELEADYGDNDYDEEEEEEEEEAQEEDHPQEAQQGSDSDEEEALPPEDDLPDLKRIGSFEITVLKTGQFLVVNKDSSSRLTVDVHFQISPGWRVETTPTPSGPRHYSTAKRICAVR